VPRIPGPGLLQGEVRPVPALISKLSDNIGEAKVSGTFIRKGSDTFLPDTLILFWREPP
jgi:hypothetical protein